jgi:sirohydrochlorin cobaltochelatase
MLWEGMGFGWAEVCFSGVAAPSVDAGLERAARLGFRRIVVFPYFLFTGILIKRINELTREVAGRHPGIEFLEASYLSHHPLVVGAFAERAAEVGVSSPAMNCQMCKYRTQIVGYESEQGAPQQGHHHHVSGIGTDADHEHEHEHDHDHHHHDHGHGHDHAHDHCHSHDHDHRHSHSGD